MKYFKVCAIIFGVVFLVSCSEKTSDISSNNENQNEGSLSKVQILNFGTFHMGFTPDANTTKFDEEDKKNQQRVHAVAEKLSDFKPTVILVEQEPKYNKKIQQEYSNYVNNPDTVFEAPSEIELLAYELGRLSWTERIYGIDHKMGYNYRIGQEIDNMLDPEWYNKYYQNPLQFYPTINVNRDSLSLLNKLKLMNRDRFLDFVIAVNADMLTHAGTESSFEGADEAAKYYKRNLRMYSNLNRINLTADDRVFILMGASHTAFFRDFMRGDPKYEMVDTFDYLE
jgi:hypothetical protein